MKSYIKSDFEFLPIIEAIISSREIALKYFKTNQDIQLKNDDSPVTKADLEINSHLIFAINKAYPKAAIISEENSAENNIEALLQDFVFIIDPIDGTSSFIKGSPEFTVNIALKVKNELLLGAIYFPVEDVLYYSENKLLFKFENASKKEIRITKVNQKKFLDKKKIIIIATRREDELLEIKHALKNAKYDLEFVSYSSSAKFCYLAEGKADIYYRAAKIKLWDVAAGFAICKAVGLEIIDHKNNDLMNYILDKNYIETISENQFRIEAFIIKNSSIIL